MHLGIIIIRFEMPYNVWCEACHTHIGKFLFRLFVLLEIVYMLYTVIRVAMGVRFNAEKTKVGNYYSTPIYRFKMRCHWCEKFFEMETDPENRDYKIISGLRKQERKWDPSANGQFAPEGSPRALCFKPPLVAHSSHWLMFDVDAETKAKLEQDAMFKLEHAGADTQRARSAAPHIDDIRRAVAGREDDYALNSAARALFRVWPDSIPELKVYVNAVLIGVGSL